MNTQTVGAFNPNMRVGLYGLGAEHYCQAKADILGVVRELRTFEEKAVQELAQKIFEAIEILRAVEFIIDAADIELPKPIESCEINNVDGCRNYFEDEVVAREKIIDHLMMQKGLAVNFVERYFDRLLIRLRYDQDTVLSAILAHVKAANGSSINWTGIGGVGIKEGSTSIVETNGYKPEDDPNLTELVNLKLVRRTVKYEIDKTEAGKLLDDAEDEEALQLMTETQKDFLGKVERKKGAKKPYWRLGKERSERPIRLKAEGV